jgi:hypothetical protein
MPQLGYGHFLSYSFQLIIRQSSFELLTLSLNSEYSDGIPYFDKEIHNILLLIFCVSNIPLSLQKNVS